MKSIGKKNAELLSAAINKIGKPNKIICNGNDVTAKIYIMFGTIEYWLSCVNRKMAFAVTRINGIITLYVAAG